MRRINGISAALVCACICAMAARASEDMLIIEQDYNIVEHAKDVVNARDIRQILYVTRDMVCIDEYGNGGKTPSESYLLDLKNQRIVNLDHDNKKLLLSESFDERRKRLTQKKAEVQGDLAALPPGPQRDKIINLYRAMLDGERTFALLESDVKKNIAGADCKTVKIVDAKKPDYVALEASVNPAVELPYDNSEVLYLLKIIGENMAAFLKENKTTFTRLPMELHVDLAAGGKLDTKVISVKQLKADEFDPKSRALGDPFLIPADYAAPKPKLGPKAPVETLKKERAD